MDFWTILNEPIHDISCFNLNTNNKGTDQPANLRRLNCAFVVRLSDSKEDTVVTSKFSTVYLISVLSRLV